MTNHPNHRRPAIRETHALAYWRAVCSELRLLRAASAALPECNALRLAGYTPREAAAVLS